MRMSKVIKFFSDRKEFLQLRKLNWDGSLECRAYHYILQELSAIDNAITLAQAEQERRQLDLLGAQMEREQMAANVLSMEVCHG